CMQDLELPLTF
nr:immunoglobulin light chain junction region [Macaca mulatta]